VIIFAQVDRHRHLLFELQTCHLLEKKRTFRKYCPVLLKPLLLDGNRRG
jgi:hypothetical protein